MRLLNSSEHDLISLRPRELRLLIRIDSLRIREANSPPSFLRIIILIVVGVLSVVVIVVVCVLICLLMESIVSGFLVLVHKLWALFVG
jgi:hypothetical protein